MRMFLVCMCDIFLILYLTNLGQVDRNAVSDLTVADYLELKEAEAELQQSIVEHKEQLAALGSELGVLRKESESQAEVLRQREEAFKQAVTEVKSVKAAHSDESARAQALAQELKTAEAKKADVARELSRTREAAEAERKRLIEARRRREEMQKDLEKALAAAEAERQRAEQERKRSEEALRVAEQAALARGQAEKERQLAEETARLARSAAEEARLKEESARARAQAATELALSSKVKAITAEKKARVASTREKRAKKALNTVIQPKESAYEENIERRIVAVVIKSKYENMLIGNSRDTVKLQGVIAEIGARQVVFVPFRDSSILEQDRIHRVKRYEVEIDGVRTRELLVLPGEKRIVGFVVPDVKQLPKVKRPEQKLIKGLMPTLFAVRSQEPRNFSDRIRGVSSDFFVFKRDRLLMGGDYTYSFKAEGFRGTGDFGERIVTGDTVVDFAGNVIAVAVSENELVQILNRGGWKGISLSQDSAAHSLQKLWNVILSGES